MAITVPATFLQMPRWWHASAAERAWLDRLESVVEHWCDRWRLSVDGPVAHGSNALVVPVVRSGERAALRLSAPSDDLGPMCRALRVWRGHGVVRLLDSDLAGGALLLERLHQPTLDGVDLAGAITELGRIARRLAIPLEEATAAAVPDARDAVDRLTPTMRATVARLGSPVGDEVLGAAERAARTILAGERPQLAVNADLHPGQVMQRDDGSWCVIDPVLQRGDPERTAVEVLWHLVDEMADGEIVGWVDRLAAAGDLDPGLCRSWACWRSLDYLLWGRENGLTEDPARCVRILDEITGAVP